MKVKKIICLLIPIMVIATFIFSTPVFASDNKVNLFTNTGTTYRGNRLYSSTGNDFNVFSHNQTVEGKNVFGGVIVRVNDRIQWTVNKRSNTFRTSDYRPGSVSVTSPWFSPWKAVGSPSARVWDRTIRQMEGSSAVGFGFGIGLSGNASASKSGAAAKGSLSVTVGQVSAYWSGSSLNTTSNASRTHLYRRVRAYR